jgi:hypothetical protein
MENVSVLNRDDRFRGVLSAQAIIHLHPFLQLNILLNIFIQLLLVKLLVAFIFKFLYDLIAVTLKTRVTPTITH